MLPIFLLFALQAIDIGLHVATDQFELIRTVSSLIAAGGALLMLLFARRAPAVGIIAGAGYLLLNGIFLAQNGLTNPATETLRVPLFGFIALTVILMIWCLKSARTRAA